MSCEGSQPIAAVLCAVAAFSAMATVGIAPAGADDDVCVALHKREKSGMGYWGHPGICTVTFCQGDAEQVFAALKPKVRAAIDANPWIAGRLTAAKTLVHPKVGSDDLVDKVLSLRKNAGVNRSAPYPVLVKATGGDPEMALQNAGKCVSRGDLVTKLVVVEPEQRGGEFAIIFSMSHVAADGHDYYRIYNMIAGTASVASLNPVRVVEYETTEYEWTGIKDFKWLSGFGLIKGMLMGALFGPKAQWCCYEVDEGKVAQLKAVAAKDGGVPFVSTNDVITSHFCKAARMRVAMMVTNCACAHRALTRPPPRWWLLSRPAMLLNCISRSARVSCLARSSQQDSAADHRRERRVLRGMHPTRPAELRRPVEDSKVPECGGAVHAPDALAAPTRDVRLVPNGPDHLVGLLPL